MIKCPFELYHMYCFTKRVSCIRTKANICNIKVYKTFKEKKNINEDVGMAMADTIILVCSN